MSIALNLLAGFKDSLQAPWTFVVVAITIGFTCLVLLDSSVFGPTTAFKFAMVIVGAFFTNLAQAVALRAYPTMLLMFCGMLVISLCAATALPADTFKDILFENWMLGMAGSIAILIGMLLERLKKDA